MERLKNFKTLAYPEIDRKKGFDEIVNSPIYRNYVISEDGKTSGIVVYLKKDERLAEYIKTKDKYFIQSNNSGLSSIIKVEVKIEDHYDYSWNSKENNESYDYLFSAEGKAKVQMTLTNNKEKRFKSKQCDFAPSVNSRFISNNI